MAKKEVNVELNMTPFIGLFALLVCNLLLTAVWNHLTALETNTENSTASEQLDEPDPNKVNLSVTILKSGVEMSENSTGVKIPHSGDSVFVDGVVAKLKDWRMKYPDRKDIILNTENGVSYKMLVTVFDTLTGEGWHDVGVSSQ
jgi:biopolymer transport protein ExbD